MRKEITQFLSNLLERKLLGTYYASEVTFDYGRGKGKETRVDYLQFTPKNQSISGIEHGVFTAYEVKSCKADYNSGHGLNFEMDKNYIVTTMRTYKEIVNEIPWNIGVMVACPFGKEKTEEFENPTSLSGIQPNGINGWELKVVKNAHSKDRHRPVSQLLFYMLRSGK